nr:transcription initiation factor IIB family protein [Halobacterium sp. R2-5]
MAPTTDPLRTRPQNRSETTGVGTESQTPTTSVTDSAPAFCGSNERTSTRQRSQECSECGAAKPVTDSGSVYCGDCGVVLSEGLLERSEPRWRDRADRRLGPSQSIQWLDTGSEIGQAGAEATERFTRYDDRLTNSERSVVRGLREVRSVSSGVELPKPMRERAAYLYRQCAGNDLLVGRSIEAFAAACVFLAARERHYPATVDCVAAYSPVAASPVRHHVQVVKTELEVTVPPAHPRDFLAQVVSRLDLGPSVERVAAQYLERVTAEGIHVGKHPAAVAATIVYVAASEAGRNLTQAAAADAADVSTVTISRHAQDVESVVSGAGEI